MSFYESMYDTIVKGGLGSLKQLDRERSLQTLMRINLLKRLESSVDAFRITLSKMLNNIDTTIGEIDKFDSYTSKEITAYKEIDNINLDDEDDWLDEEYSIGDNVKINLSDMDRISWREDLTRDREIISYLLEEMGKITPLHDLKLSTLKYIIEEKITNPINKGNKKIIIFTAFSDTADYLYEEIAPYVLDNFNLHTAKVVGSDVNKNTLKLKTIFILSSPVSPLYLKKRLDHAPYKRRNRYTNTTDCISEGQNLQDCDYLINYDIHWNPVRITQRFGRIDRIGSKNDVIQLVNFWPNMS